MGTLQRRPCRRPSVRPPGGGVATPGAKRSDPGTVPAVGGRGRGVSGFGEKKFAKHYINHRVSGLGLA